ncbi:hypothetical protein O6H91_05G086300 [Diphasiastrum complanatum]|uniref:Uncharacterized protein n=1 Tax=Diphasiastrum complanatum TaxID=34168 RepID=A0ACC2DQV0_DIPCM|nr:hypothetical protein O6H91_05G086300 [Diphasiastrum complanatum]
MGDDADANGAGSSAMAPAHSAADAAAGAEAAEADDGDIKVEATAAGSFVLGGGSYRHYHSAINTEEEEADDPHWEMAPPVVVIPEVSGILSAAESLSVQSVAEGRNYQLSRYGKGSEICKRRVLEWVQSSSQEGLNIAEDRSVEQTMTDASTGEVRNRHAITESHSDVCSETCESNKIQERQAESAVGMAMEHSEGEVRLCYAERISVQEEGETKENDQNTSENGDSLWRNNSARPSERHKREREGSSSEAFVYEDEALQSKEHVEFDGNLGKEQQKLLSKNAQKKLQKVQRYQLKKKEKKALEKERRHQETARKRQEWQTKMASLPSELQERALDERKLAREARREESIQKKERLRQALQSGQDLVLDLDFCEHMKPGEVISLSQQVMYSYAANARAIEPMRLSLTGCKEEIRAQLEKVSGFSNWLLHKEERSYLEVFADRKADLVYLTADSDQLLDKLEKSKIYIVGGLVDRNRWKGMTYKKAKEQGIATARLPIAENLNMTASKVIHSTSSDLLKM